MAGLEEGLESESRRKRLTAWTVIWISRFTLLTDFHFGTELSRQASQANYLPYQSLKTISVDRNMSLNHEKTNKIVTLS